MFTLGNALARVIGGLYHYGYNAGAPSPGRKTMTTPKAKLAGLALIAVLCAGVLLGLTASAWAGLD